MAKPKNSNTQKDMNDESKLAGVLDFSGKMLYDAMQIRKLATLTAAFYSGLIEEGLNEQQALYLTGLLIQSKNNS